MHIDFDSSGSAALEGCTLGTSSNPVTVVTIDEANSTIGE